MSVEDTGSAPQTGQEGALSAVGKRLAAARQDQARELTSVASDLHLKPEVVTALETGDESALPSLTFVRGYVKSYARLLGLDEKQLLTQLPTTEDYRPAPLKSVGMRRKQLRFPLGKLLLWLITLPALVTLVVYGIPVVERLMSRTGQLIEPGALPLPLGETQQETQAGSMPALPELSEQLPTEQADEPPVGLPAEAELEQAVVPEAELEQLPVPDVEPEQPTAPAAAPLALPAESQAVAEGTKVAGPAVITLRFSEDSWVEMESHGRKLVVGTQPAGSERTVRAEPPVQILLGNAPGIVLEYRGKVVDLKPYQRGKVARLVLDD